jgi:uroporphyrinogen decarboxylase
VGDVEKDGICGMLPDNRQADHIRKYRAVYACTPNAPIYHREGWYYSVDAWREQGLPADLQPNTDAWNEFFSFDPPAVHRIEGLGWCEAELIPGFEEKVLERRNDGTEVIRDFAGRKVLMFHDARSGFMPEYMDHPVKDLASWEEEIKWRLDPETPERKAQLAARVAAAVPAAKQGCFMVQRMIGGYMYLRSLMGPEDLLYMFFDDPELIHACMQQWFELADAVTAEHQKHVSFDEVFISEDICYNNGPLISPDMIEEFLMPYYCRLMDNIRSRQLDQERHLFMQVDTDGKCMPVIDVYQKQIGMDVMSPFEVASGCDVVQVGKDYPNLIMHHGIDKRILAKSKDAIDRELERIIPVMQARGGYFPACDHAVPAEVSLDNCLHYRKRMVEMGG